MGGFGFWVIETSDLFGAWGLKFGLIFVPGLSNGQFIPLGTLQTSAAPGLNFRFHPVGG
jgi:hypothetical protein